MLFTEYNFFKLNFIEPASPLMYGIIELHDHIFFFLNMILFLVLFLLITTIDYFSYSTNTKINRYLLTESVKSKYEWIRLNHGTTIEIIWTVVPSIVLVFIAIPSFALLYATDELVDPSVTIQVVGHQWYRSYEYNDISVITQEVKWTQFKKEAIQVAKNIAIFSPFFGVDISQEDNFVKYVVDLVELELYSSYLNTNFEDLNNYFRSGIDLFDIKTILISNIDSFDEITSENLKWGQNMGYWFKPIVRSGSFEFDSYMKQEADLQLGELRLYETEHPLVLPKNTHIRFMITADDVIHSWSVPALGIKVDAVPGRINHAHTYIKRSGIFYGQCSELCGVNHAFMPIQILVLEPNMYYSYLNLALLNK